MSKLKVLNHKNIKFACRHGFSDEKTFDEVIVKDVYQKNKLEHLIL